MKRQGECKRCGKCCTFDNLWATLSPGMKGVVAKIVGEEKIKKTKGMKCPFLEFNGELVFCLQYKNRPPFCREHPKTEKDLVEGCGYYFKQEVEK